MSTSTPLRGTKPRISTPKKARRSPPITFISGSFPYPGIGGRSNERRLYSQGNALECRDVATMPQSINGYLKFSPLKRKRCTPASARSPDVHAADVSKLFNTHCSEVEKSQMDHFTFRRNKTVLLFLLCSYFF